jgi:hypothetical protein
MLNLPKYTLSHDQKKDDWALRETAPVGSRGGLTARPRQQLAECCAEPLGQVADPVKIQKMDGTFQEERTFPRSKDPKRSPG